MNGLVKAGIIFVGMVFTYDLLKRRFSIKHAEKLNDQKIMQLKLGKDLLESGWYLPKSDINIGDLYVSDQHPTKE